jgi:hypothetical protein
VTPHATLRPAASFVLFRSVGSSFKIMVSPLCVAARSFRTPRTRSSNLCECKPFGGCALASVPRYYFDCRDGDRFIEDDVGLDFDSIEQARDEATAALAGIAKDVLPGSLRRELSIEVRDEAKEPLLRTCLVFEAIRLR